MMASPVAPPLDLVFRDVLPLTGLIVLCIFQILEERLAVRLLLRQWRIHVKTYRPALISLSLSSHPPPPNNAVK